MTESKVQPAAFNLRDTATYLGVTVDVVKELHRAGHFPHARRISDTLRSRWLIPKRDLDHFLYGDSAVSPDGEIHSLTDAAVSKVLARFQRRFPDVMRQANYGLDGNVWIGICDQLNKQIADHGWTCLADVVDFVDGWSRESEGAAP